MSKRNYYRYNLKREHKIVYKGITKDPDERTNQHKGEGKRFTHMQVIKPVVTKEAAETWEEESLREYRYDHGGRNPLYNETEK